MKKLAAMMVVLGLAVGSFAGSFTDGRDASSTPGGLAPGGANGQVLVYQDGYFAWYTDTDAAFTNWANTNTYVKSVTGDWTGTFDGLNGSSYVTNNRPVVTIGSVTASSSLVVGSTNVFTAFTNRPTYAQVQADRSRAVLLCGTMQDPTNAVYELSYSMVTMGTGFASTIYYQTREGSVAFNVVKRNATSLWDNVVVMGSFNAATNAQNSTTWSDKTFGAGWWLGIQVSAATNCTNFAVSVDGRVWQ